MNEPTARRMCLRDGAKLTTVPFVRIGNVILTVGAVGAFFNAH